ncbi:uncharacterized protein LOC143284912 [Babylonia areolata]|uniref:uncharacterized protein LOC143284912 n=1 Tax=Babylonia areolata TaxID=304850 RepID=UPI003FD41591
MMLHVLVFSVFCACSLGHTRAMMYSGHAAMGGACGAQGHGTCWGTSYSAMGKAFCCDGVPYPCPEPKGWACCGKLLVDRQTTLCCNGDPYPKAPNMTCCDKHPMNANTEICCDGDTRLNHGNANLYCCNKTPYDPSRQACCHKTPYDPIHQACCNQDVLPKAAAQHNLACAPGNTAPDRQNPPCQCSSQTTPMPSPSAASSASGSGSASSGTSG